MNFLLRKVISKSSPDMDVTVDGENITLVFKTTLKTITIKYTINQEVEVDTDDGKYMVVTTYSDGKLVTVQKPCKGNDSKETRTTRFINSDGELEAIPATDKESCKRVYKRV